MVAEIIYSGIREVAKRQWDLKKLETLARKINRENNTIHISETYNSSPLVHIELMDEKLDIVVDSMGED